MLLLAFFLIPSVLADLQEKTINNYVVKIDGNTLKSVEPTSTSSRVCNLSGLDLQVLEDNVFDNLPTVKNLDLGNNSLSSIPNGIFSKLGNLEHLNLANNNITNFGRPFEGLGNLKTLNISNNPLTNLGGSDLYGLSKSSVIFTKGLSLESLDAYVFEKEPGAVYAWASSFVGNRNEDDDNYHMIKVCIQDGVLQQVDRLWGNESMPIECQISKVYKYSNQLYLDNLGIANFKRGWFRLEIPIMSIILEGNEIVNVTSELLNDLPESVRQIYLSKNKIERLNRGILKNGYISSLRLDSNSISDIEDDALANMTNLGDLVLDDNLLTNTKFAASLPSSVFILSLKQNGITEITPGSLSRLVGLYDLYLDGNLIQEIQPDVLRGLSQLYVIGLSNNRISRIEPTTFQQTRLLTVNISNNSIASFEKGTFDNLNITTLDVSYNKLSSIKENFPDGLPPDVRVLKLDFNEIKELEHENFEKSQDLNLLSLSGNKIRKIKPGTFDLGSLYQIILNNNLLNEIDVESFRGLKNVNSLSLRENGITSIPKGLLKHLPSLSNVDLSKNPIKRLQNGALNGLRKSTYKCKVYLNEVPLDVIEGGLFDDV